MLIALEILYNLLNLYEYVCGIIHLISYFKKIHWLVIKKIKDTNHNKIANLLLLVISY